MTSSPGTTSGLVMANNQAGAFKWMVVCAVVCVASLGAARRAEACGSGRGAVPAAVVAIGVAEAGATLGFGLADLAVSDHSTGYGVAETLINTPLAVLWGPPS